MSDYWINALLYTIGWCWAVYFGAHGNPLLAGFGAFSCCALILALQSRKDLRIYYQDLFLAIYALLSSFGMESIFIHFDFIDYKTINVIPFLPPIWIFSLYPLFALTLNHSFKIINSSPVYPFLIGCMAPLTYLAGHRIGACEFPRGAYAMIAFFIPAWSLFLSGLRLLNARLATIAASVLENKELLCMLYDEECPICSREVRLLKQAKPTNLKFVNIADQNEIPYEEAMQEMTAIQNGKVHKGIEAFKEIYARAGWYFLTILISAPGFHWLFKKMYRLFALCRRKRS